MPSHHAVCVTDDESSVVKFLDEVLGMPVQSEMWLPGSHTASMLQWPDGNEGASALMLGSGPAGLVEVVSIPASLAGVAQPGIGMLSFAVRDLAGTVERCRNLGLAVSEISRVRSSGVDVSVATVTAGGIKFELVRFEAGGRGGTIS